MFKKPFNDKLKEATQTLKEDRRKILGYLLISITFATTFIWTTLHALNNELADHWFFKAYLFSFITGLAMWLFIKNEAKSAERARQAARNVAKARKASEARVAELTLELASAKDTIHNLNAQLHELSEWNERSQKANQTLSKELKTAKRTIARLSAPTKVVSVKISSNAVEADDSNTETPPNKDVNDIDAVLGLMQKI